MRPSHNFSAFPCMEINFAGDTTEGFSSADSDQVDGGEAITHEKDDFIIAFSVVSGKYFVFISHRKVLRYMYT